VKTARVFFGGGFFFLYDIKKTIIRSVRYCDAKTIISPCKFDRAHHVRFGLVIYSFRYKSTFPFDALTFYIVHCVQQIDLNSDFELGNSFALTSGIVFYIGIRARCFGRFGENENCNIRE